MSKVEVLDYLDDDDGVLALCEDCAKERGLTAFCIGVVLGAPVVCEFCMRGDQV